MSGEPRGFQGLFWSYMFCLSRMSCLWKQMTGTATIFSLKISNTMTLCVRSYRRHHIPYEEKDTRAVKGNTHTPFNDRFRSRFKADLKEKISQITLINQEKSHLPGYCPSTDGDKETASHNHPAPASIRRGGGLSSIYFCHSFDSLLFFSKLFQQPSYDLERICRQLLGIQRLA